MPLILVIVADPHEAAQLATLIQGRLPVDLVQAAEVGEGLLALEDRIPDLILTSPLMSPFDDGVLDEYLRDLGPAGAHVQTLRIPVLSQAPKKTKRLGFSLRRRSKPEAPDARRMRTEGLRRRDRAVPGARGRREASCRVERPGARRRGTRTRQSPSRRSPRNSGRLRIAKTSPAVNASWSRRPEPEPEAPSRNRLRWRADLLDRPPVEETPIYQPSPVAYEETVGRIRKPDSRQRQPSKPSGSSTGRRSRRAEPDRKRRRRPHDRRSHRAGSGRAVEVAEPIERRQRRRGSDRRASRSRPRTERPVEAARSKQSGVEEAAPIRRVAPRRPRRQTWTRTRRRRRSRPLSPRSELRGASPLGRLTQPVSVPESPAQTRVEPEPVVAAARGACVRSKSI